MDDRQLLPKFSIDQWVILWVAILGLTTSFFLYMNPDDSNAIYVSGCHAKLPGACMSRQWFDMECPGCGLTRSIVSISHGDLARSLHFNIAGILFYGYAVGYVGYAVLRNTIPSHSFFHSAAAWRLFVRLTLWTVFAQWCLKAYGVL